MKRDKWDRNGSTFHLNQAGLLKSDAAIIGNEVLFYCVLAGRLHDTRARTYSAAKKLLAMYTYLE